MMWCVSFTEVTHGPAYSGLYRQVVLGPAYSDLNSQVILMYTVGAMVLHWSFLDQPTVVSIDRWPFCTSGL